MSKRQDTDLLCDLEESMERIHTYTINMSYENFVCDHKTQDAVIRNIEIMGEAVKLLSITTKEQNTSIPWKSIAGTRDKLIHDYFGVNIDVVWGIVKNDLPKLLLLIKSIVKQAS